MQLINNYVTIRLIKKGLTNISDFNKELLQKEYERQRGLNIE
ncbi:MAG: hypothetical protein Q8831_02770 ['Bonamia sp.' little leaf phytoplasma]|uniref:Uncharacterized protein n=1 Tax=Candidatus Phytoplasma bonamiae TaxID=2982626 RepID=A0ABT9D4I0_9MOLU|nr:hypothetical protein ['Bonamia sp.' little leaf phytoplasma]MDO8064343.1 hypothetical protein ['Bonamia sp.' little leaf phytoplasma]MDV3174935.1 hypothetical protein ['Bonamia sp.' little leaf phytoplasma]